MTMRLSVSSLAGTARTLVAVGTVSEAFMFLTTLAAAPRSGVRFGPSPSAVALAAGCGAGLAGAAGCCWAARSAARLTTVPSERAAVDVAREAGAVAPGVTAAPPGRLAEP